jgi:hypothetical protein
MEKRSKFNLRSFTSFSLVISTIVMSWSGFILYVAPPGRIANWGDWRLMLFTKAEWQALHTIFSYMFFILFVIHLFFVNWKTFLNYIKSKLKSGLNRRWEMAAAIVVSAVFFIGTLESWTPFGPVMTFGENVKQSWDKKYVSPPVAHMEEYNLAKMVQYFPGVKSEEMIKTLNDSNIVVRDPENNLKTIASDNDITPSRIYQVLTSRYNKQQIQVTGEAPSGVGKMTIKQIAERVGKEPADLLKILKDKGVEATAETTMRTVSDQLGISPHDLYSSFTK